MFSKVLFAIVSPNETDRLIYLLSVPEILVFFDRATRILVSV